MITFLRKLNNSFKHTDRRLKAVNDKYLFGKIGNKKRKIIAVSNYPGSISGFIWLN